MRRAVLVAIAMVPLSAFSSDAAGSAYQVTEVIDGAAITGRVSFDGTPPPPKVFDVEKDPEVCGSRRSLVEVDVRDGFLKGAVIVLEGVEKGKPFPERTYRADPPGEGEFHYAPGGELALDIRMKTCNFGPFTGVFAPETPMEFLNQDPMKHTIQTFVVRGRRGNIFKTVHNRDARPGDPFQETFSTSQLEESRVVRLICNRHDFMRNWLYAVQTPYFAISDEDGAFTIDEIPPGEYQVVAWHPLLGIHRQPVKVGADETLEVSVEFSAE